MLTCYRSTAWIPVVMLVWAVFSSPPVTAADRPLGTLESGMNDLVYTLSRSIVTVQNLRRVDAPAFGNPNNETVENLVATGIICDTFGHVLTSAAAVVDHDDLLIAFENHQVPAELVAIDYFNDLALLRPKRRLGTPVRLSEKRVCAGQMVVAVGHAFGLRASPVIGFCAGVRPDGTLQFTVPVSPTFMGGGVFDLSGNMLGIINATMGPSAGVAVAVPAYSIPGTVSHLVQHGDRQAGYIGVSTADLEITPGIELQSPLQLTGSGQPKSSVIDRGVIVTYLAPSSPATKSGLARGDVIVGFQGMRIYTALDLSRMVRQARPGSTAEVGFIRDNRYQTARVQIGRKTLAAQFSETNQFQPPEPTPDSLSKLLQYLKQEVSRLEHRLKRAR